MDRRRLKPAFLDDPGSGLDLDSRLKPPSKIVLDIIRADIANWSLAKGVL